MRWIKFFIFLILILGLCLYSLRLSPLPRRRRVPDRAPRALMVEQRAGDFFYGGTPEGRPQ